MVLKDLTSVFLACSTFTFVFGGVDAACNTTNQREYLCTFDSASTAIWKSSDLSPDTSVLNAVTVVRLIWTAPRPDATPPLLSLDPTSFSNITNLQELHITNFRDFMPQSLDPIAPNLKKLTLIDVNFTPDGATFPNLEELHLRRNNIKQLWLPLIQAAAPKLKTLRIMQNEISAVGYVNTTLPELEVLDLSRSKVTGTSTLPVGMFDSFPRLKHLSLANMDLTEAIFSVPAHLRGKDLHEINLAGNQYSSFGPRYFSNQTNLKVLNLSSNLQLTTITGALAGLRLESLNLSLCPLDFSRTPPGDTFRDASIRVLYLSKLTPSYVPPAARPGSGWNVTNSRINGLQILDASGHYIGDDFTLGSISAELLVARLRKCQLRSIPPDFVQGTPRLTILDLSDNEIINITSKVFTDLWKPDSPIDRFLLYRNPNLQCSCKLARFFVGVANDSDCYRRNKEILCRDFVGGNTECPQCFDSSVAVGAFRAIHQLGTYGNYSHCGSPRCPSTLPRGDSDLLTVSYPVIFALLFGLRQLSLFSA